MSDMARRILQRWTPRRCGAFVGALSGDIAGNVLPLAAVGTIILAGLVGGGVDMARAYKADRRLQAACDAGALAGRRAVTTNGFDTTALAQANQYFNANYSSIEEDTSDANFSASSNDNGNTVVGTASASQSTIIMRIFGFDTIPLSVSCTASMGVGNSDIMFVLDNTGSMAWTPGGRTTSDFDETRMFALQEAMKAFYDTVDASVSGSNARIRYGFVPYSSAVNVGHLLYDLDPSYIADSATYQSREPVNWGPVVDTWSGSGEETEQKTGDYERTGSAYEKKSNCTNNKPENETNFTSYGAPYETTSTNFDPTREQKVTATGTHQDYRKAQYECAKSEGWGGGWYVYRRYVTRTVTSYDYEARDPVARTPGQTFSDWLYRPVTYNTSVYKTFASVQLPTRQSGSPKKVANTSSHSWEGCVMERDTTDASSFTFASLVSGITPYTLDLDIDTAPGAGNDTKWKPLWPEATYRRRTLLASLDGDSYDGDSYTYCPAQSQLLTEMDEDDFDDYAEALRPVGSTYHDIGLIWGARLSSPTGIFADSVNADPDNGGTVSRHLIFMTDGELAPTFDVNSSYGVERLDRRVAGGSNDQDELEARHWSRFLAVCEAVKARGIRVWVIAFGSDVALDTNLTSCASPDSAFKADDAEDLDTYFQEIANQVGELRIVQ